MRLFGIPGGSLNDARSTYGFMDPFNLPIGSPDVYTTVVPLILDMEQPIMVGGIITFPDWAYALIPKQNPINIHLLLQGNNGHISMINGTAGPFSTYLNQPQYLSVIDSVTEFEQGVESVSGPERKVLKGNNTSTDFMTGSVEN